MPYAVEDFRAMCLGYGRAIDENQIGFEAFTKLQPWYFLSDTEIFDVREQWPSEGNQSPLVAFAVRQDCDDIACFELDDNKVVGILLIQGWVSGSFEVICDYDSFESWLYSAKEDARNASR